MAKLDGNVHVPHSIGVFNTKTGEYTPLDDTPLDDTPRLIIASAIDEDAPEPRVYQRLTEAPVVIATFTAPNDSPLARFLRRLIDWRERVAQIMAQSRADRESRN